MEEKKKKRANDTSGLTEVKKSHNYFKCNQKDKLVLKKLKRIAEPLQASKCKFCFKS